MITPAIAAAIERVRSATRARVAAVHLRKQKQEAVAAVQVQFAAALDELNAVDEAIQKACAECQEAATALVTVTEQSTA